MNQIIQDYKIGTLYCTCIHETKVGEINILIIKPKMFQLNNKKNYLCNGPWSLVGLWHFEAPTLSRQSAHRWQIGCQAYAPAVFYLLEDS
jgi:hypothetical protein